MNRHFLPFLNRIVSNAGLRELLLWFLVHLSVPLLLALSVFYSGKVSINANLFDMLPQPDKSRAVIEADRLMGEKNGREIIVLSAAPDFETAKNGAALLCAEFEHSPYFENISFYFDSQVIADFYRYLYNYRFVIAGSDTLALLENGGEEEIAYDALARAFGAINLLPLDIENDPFLLAERRMEHFLTSSLLFMGSMSVKDDVLAAQQDGLWYILLRLTLTPQAVSVRADRNAIGAIYSAADVIKKSLPDLEFYFSGIPFHSYESSSNAQRETSLIGTITLIIILILFLYIFRSPLPVLLSITAAGISLGFATATALLVFREIHVITFVFGTTLIGTCVDYSVHFFVHWKGNPALENGIQIRSFIKKSIIMSFISTEICFFVFILAPFPLLKQFAVFSMAGLLSSFLTCLCVYPRLPMPDADKRRLRFFTGKYFLLLKSITVPRWTRAALFSCCIAAVLLLIIFNFSSVKIENDITSLYTMSDSLLESEKQMTRVFDYSSSPWYFIVSGSSAEETLENEENLIRRLEEEKARGNLGSFLGTSVFVPSVKSQKNTYNAMKALLPLVPSQYEYFGLPLQYAQAFENEFAAAEKYCLPEDVPSFAGISNLWMGGQGGNFYSCVLPIKPADEGIFRAIAQEIDDVYFINKAKDIGRDLNTLTRTMLLFFMAAYIIVSVIICCVYPRKDSLKICAIPLFLSAAALAVLAVNSIPMGFFSVAALVLVFGLGLDYIFYMIGGKRGEEGRLTLLGVVLSFLTTLLSFGALVLSSFMPVHIFGLTVSAGLSAAFISAMFLQARKD
jgi:predicted exporter